MADADEVVEQVSRRPAKPSINTIKGTCWVVVINVHKNDFTKEERMELHLDLTKDDARSRFGE